MGEGCVVVTVGERASTERVIGMCAGLTQLLGPNGSMATQLTLPDYNKEVL
jgi:hypothetical protein